MKKKTPVKKARDELSEREITKRMDAALKRSLQTPPKKRAQKGKREPVKNPT